MACLARCLLVPASAPSGYCVHTLSAAAARGAFLAWPCQWVCSRGPLCTSTVHGCPSAVGTWVHLDWHSCVLACAPASKAPSMAASGWEGSYCLAAAALGLRVHSRQFMACTGLPSRVVALEGLAPSVVLPASVHRIWRMHQWFKQ